MQMEDSTAQRPEAAINAKASNSAPVRAKTHKRLDLLLNAALALMLCACAAVYVLPIFGHELHAPGSVHDFGVVQAGTEVRHDFTVRNLHPWTVTVSSVNSDCGCTRSVVGKTLPFRLAPLQAVTVSTALQTRGRKGHIEQDVRVITDDNEKGTLLRLRGGVS